jgi:hypothetical protein
MTTYTCTKCGLQVVVEDTINPSDIRMIKACGCDAPITADMSADMAGVAELA